MENQKLKEALETIKLITKKIENDSFDTSESLEEAIFSLEKAKEVITASKDGISASDILRDAEYELADKLITELNRLLEAMKDYEKSAKNLEDITNEVKANIFMPETNKSIDDVINAETEIILENSDKTVKSDIMYPYVPPEEPAIKFDFSELGIKMETDEINDKLTSLGIYFEQSLFKSFSPLKDIPMVLKDVPASCLNEFHNIQKVINSHKMLKSPSREYFANLLDERSDVIANAFLKMSEKGAEISKLDFIEDFKSGNFSETDLLPEAIKDFVMPEKPDDLMLLVYSVLNLDTIKQKFLGDSNFLDSDYCKGMLSDIVNIQFFLNKFISYHKKLAPEKENWINAAEKILNSSKILYNNLKDEYALTALCDMNMFEIDLKGINFERELNIINANIALKPKLAKDVAILKKNIEELKQIIDSFNIKDPSVLNAEKLKNLYNIAENKYILFMDYDINDTIVSLRDKTKVLCVVLNCINKANEVLKTTNFDLTPYRQTEKTVDDQPDTLKEKLKISKLLTELAIINSNLTQSEKILFGFESPVSLDNAIKKYFDNVSKGKIPAEIVIKADIFEIAGMSTAQKAKRLHEIFLELSEEPELLVDTSMFKDIIKSFNDKDAKYHFVHGTSDIDKI